MPAREKPFSGGGGGGTGGGGGAGGGAAVEIHCILSQDLVVYYNILQHNTVYHNTLFDHITTGCHIQVLYFVAFLLSGLKISTAVI